ncbi:tripartite tricarboxylate transporter substrate binding protein [Advenella alkanexedens]|uniref:Tripartite tricarboxylate transporter substrate binding protein n=1 Tax=Advenella alkanexedens TaxID=1481665 RepID=A0ABS6NQ45_9BURK|nr:tripartite tricarboxylate transporter substrate binding protein [Advenella alkanexedens]
MKRTNISKFIGIGLVTACGIFNMQALAASDKFPDHSLQMVVGYPPGGPTDIVARIAAAEMSKVLKQSIVVDNRSGASGMIAAEFVSKAKPDGYTYLANASLHVINPSVYPSMKYDALNDFTPITQLVSVPLVLVVPKDSPFNSVQDIIDFAKKNPAKLNFGSAGNASSQQLSGELLKILAEVDMQHIPYRGSSPALTDLIGNQLDFMFDSMPSAMPFIKSGQLKALAVTVKKPVDALPGVPTVADSANLPEFDVSTWYGLWAPKNTPDEVVQTLWKAASEALKEPKVIEQYAQLGAEPVASDPATFKKFNETEFEKWGKIVKLSGAKAD